MSHLLKGPTLPLNENPHFVFLKKFVIVLWKGRGGGKKDCETVSEVRCYNKILGSAATTDK
jgi:hypothetical protein